jgi:hypothetical protein
MTPAFHDELTTHLYSIYTELISARVPVYTPIGTGIEDLQQAWYALRPACLLLRVPLAWRQHLECRWREHLHDPEPPLRLHWDGQRHVLLGSVQVLLDLAHHSAHPLVIRLSVWYNGVLVALMRHGTYAPDRGHEPAPGDELDALERREHFQGIFNQCFPWFASMPRYTITRDEDGTILSVDPVEPPDLGDIPTDPEKGYDPDATY